MYIIPNMMITCPSVTVGGALTFPCGNLPTWPLANMPGANYNLDISTSKNDHTVTVALSALGGIKVLVVDVSPGSRVVRQGVARVENGTVIWTDFDGYMYSLVFHLIEPDEAGVIINAVISVDVGTHTTPLPDPPTITIDGDFAPDTTCPTKALFIIRDDVDHSCPQPPGCCKRIPVGKVVITKFNRKIHLLPVIRGKGCTYVEKIAANLYTLENVDSSLTRITFMRLIVSYGLARLFLSYLLYGEWSTKFLTRGYYCAFIEDLKGSKYCRFLVLFETVFRGYERYYRKGVREC